MMGNTVSTESLVFEAYVVFYGMTKKKSFFRFKRLASYSEVRGLIVDAGKIKNSP